MAGLYLWVEGDDDQRFVDDVLVPILQPQFDFVSTHQYAQMKDKKVAAFLASIRSMGGRFLFLGDRDAAPCVTECKNALATRYSITELDQIVVVTRMVEGWYLAGLSDSGLRSLRRTRNEDPNVIDKQAFNSGIPRRYQSRVAYMLDVLRVYDINEARSRNDSFEYVYGNHCAP